jgi:hypothetical protein
VTEDSWDKLAGALTVAVGRKTPDDLRWVLDYIADAELDSCARADAAA